MILSIWSVFFDSVVNGAFDFTQSMSVRLKAEVKLTWSGKQVEFSCLVNLVLLD